MQTTMHNDLLLTIDICYSDVQENKRELNKSEENFKYPSAL